MKKVLSILVAIIMAVSFAGLTSTVTYAGVSSQETTKKLNTVVTEVNGQSTDDISYERDANDPNKITFTYDGDGELTEWTFPGMTENTDYTIVSEDGNSITILVSDAYTGDVTVDAQVDEEEDDEDDTTKAAKKDKSKKSPKTGAMAATGILVMGAGAAVIAAAKKKED